MIDSMKVKRSIYFATLQGYVIFETELYMFLGVTHKLESSFCFISWCLKTFCAVGALCVFSYF